MAHAVELVAAPRKYPFLHMRIADHSELDHIEGRYTCTECNRSRKFFCYNCHIPVGNLEKLLPAQVELPLQIDIIKHKKEIDGKSTAVHAAIIAKKNVHIYTYPYIPDYTKEKEGVILIFPGAQSLTVAQLYGQKIRLKIAQQPKGYNAGSLLKRRVEEELLKEEVDENSVKNLQSYTFTSLPVRRAVFIDSTWNQSRGIYMDTRLRSLPTVVLQNRCSQFWRHQRGSPRWYLATIEAIHQFLLEIHVHAWGLNAHYRGLENLEIEQQFYKIIPIIKANPQCIAQGSPYNGQYDNLLFFFAHMYDLIHKYYDHNELKSYRRPI